VAIYLQAASPFVVIPFALYAAHLFNQIRELDTENGPLCLAIFKSNRTTGLLLVATLGLGALL